MPNPILSVLIDTYNHEPYIEQAVVSAIEQDFPSADYEILVVDDGSTDRTPEIVRRFAPRVRLLTKKNGGQASAFNAAFPELRGEIVAFLDGDDWFAPGKLTALINTFEQNPEVAAVSHGNYQFNEETKELRVCAPSQQIFLHLSTPEAAREALLGWPFLITSALTVRKNVLKQVIPIPEALVFSADSTIATASMAMGVRVLPLPLSYYRLHSSNLYAVDPTDTVKMRRKYDMDDTMFSVLYQMLLRLGVPAESVSALLDGNWTYVNRMSLRTFGGNRLKAFHTEMRAFRSECKNPNMSYRLFKYLVVGGATLFLSPQHFYKMRDWYGQRNLGRIRERFATGR